MKLHNKKITLAPTDLANYLGCQHQTSLDLAAVNGGEKRPARYGPMIDALREKGMAHEQAYLEQLKASGLTVSEPSGDESPSTGKERTLEAMQSGADVIFQAGLSDDTWSGWADFLKKVDTPSVLL